MGKELNKPLKEIYDAMRTLEASVEYINDLTTNAELVGLEKWVIINQKNWRFTNKVMAVQMLCQYLGEVDGFDEAERTQWLAIALEMGPKWVAKFRRIGSFMKLAVDA